MEHSLKQKIASYGKVKGEKGSILVVGGSFEYSGAPFFAASAGLHTGVDLAFIITDCLAAPIIKSFSPDLIVFGILDHSDSNRRASCFLIGPGLSRNENSFKQVQQLLPHFNSRKIPIIFDGDGITFYVENHSIVSSLLPTVILTPNSNEFKLLEETLGVNHLISNNVIIYRKGEFDEIITKNNVFKVAIQGCPRRCGGIGDVLSGVISAVLSMTGESEKLSTDEIVECLKLSGELVRKAAFLAFETKRRSMNASDVIHNICQSFEDIVQ